MNAQKALENANKHFALNHDTAKDFAYRLLFDAVFSGGVTLNTQNFSADVNDGFVIGGSASGIVIEWHGSFEDGLQDTVKWLRAAITHDHCNYDFVGSWSENKAGLTGSIAIDWCDISKDRDQALRLGKHRGEYAIYDIARGVSINCETGEDIPNAPQQEE